MFVQKATLIGAKQFKGEVEGRAYDTCKVRVLMPVPSEADNECGLNVTEFNYGSSLNYKGLKAYTFPVECDLELEMELKSGKPTLYLKNLRINKDPKDPKDPFK